MKHLVKNSLLFLTFFSVCTSCTSLYEVDDLQETKGVQLVNQLPPDARLTYFELTLNGKTVSIGQQSLYHQFAAGPNLIPALVRNTETTYNLPLSSVAILSNGGEIGLRLQFRGRIGGDTINTSIVIPPAKISFFSTTEETRDLITFDTIYENETDIRETLELSNHAPINEPYMISLNTTIRAISHKIKMKGFRFEEEKSYTATLWLAEGIDDDASLLTGANEFLLEFKEKF